MPPNKELKLTKPDTIGASQLIPRVRRTVGRRDMMARKDTTEIRVYGTRTRERLARPDVDDGPDAS